MVEGEGSTGEQSGSGERGTSVGVDGLGFWYGSIWGVVGSEWFTWGKELEVLLWFLLFVYS